MKISIRFPLSFRHSLLASCILPFTPLAAQFMDVYIGTYTRPNEVGGIYSAQFDPATGEWKNLTLAAKTENPTFLALAPSGKQLFAAIETLAGAVQSFQIGPDRTLTFRNQQPTGGNGTCHVSLTDDGRYLLSADYGSGSAAVFPMQTDGSLAPRSDEVRFAGSGPNPSRQKQSHGHAFNAFGPFAYACDLGSDQIWSFRLRDGKLTPLGTPAGKAPPGSGPRHLVFSPDGRFVFVINEMIPGVTTLKRDPETGELLAQATLASLSPEEVDGSVSGAEIVLHPEGRWLYVSNRGHDSVTLYSVDAEGGLKVVQNFPAGVKKPRSIALDPSGKWLLAAGQEDNRITAFAIDPASGKLTPAGSVLEVPQPVCLVFAPGFSS